MTLIKGSWKTTLGGSLTATGTMLLGAGALDWMPAEHKTKAMMLGFILMAIGTFCTGFFARDNNKTSADVGLTKLDNTLTK
jgi:hypothetical protein